MDQPLSPLEPLDPHRLRDMVVDKQGVPPGSQMGSVQHWSPHVPPCNTASPASVDSPHSISGSQRLSSGSTDVNSPFPNRGASQNQGQFDFGRAPMYGSSSSSPAKNLPSQPQLMSPMGRSPQQHHVQSHPPASPFPRTSSAASSNACPSPYPQPPPQQFQSERLLGPPLAGSVMYPPAGYSSVSPRMPPAYPSGQQHYAPFPQPGQVWPGQNVHHYVGQPRMLAHQAHNVPRTMIRYPQGYPPTSMHQHMLYNRPPVRPMQFQQAPQGAQQAQTPGGGPAATQTLQPYPPYSAPPMNQQQVQQYYILQQQQRIQQQGQQPGVAPMMRPTFMGAPGTPQAHSGGVRYVAGPAGASQAPQQYGQVLGPAAAHPSPTADLRPAPPRPHLPGAGPRSTHLPQLHMGVGGVYAAGVPVQTAGGVPPGGAPGLHLAQPPGRFQRNTLYAHDPAWLQRLTDSDVFLAGCVFYVDAMESLEPTELHHQLRYYGAEVEGSLTDVVTHIVGDSMTARVRNAVKKLRNARCVSLLYLNDVIAKRKLFVPYKAAHLPSAWDLGNPASAPGHDKVFAVEGFEEEQLEAVRFLVKGVGARCTPYLTQKHAALVTCLSGGKLARAAEWDVPCANYLWLCRLYLGCGVVSEVLNPEHCVDAPGGSDLESLAHGLDKLSEHSANLLLAWRCPIAISEAVLHKAMSLRQQVEHDVLCFPHKKFKFAADAPTEEQISRAVCIFNENGRSPNVRVFFDRLPAPMLDQLERKLRFLGAQTAESIVECTHFVTPNLRRTPRLLEALALGREVVEPSWVDHSFGCLRFADSLDFRVRDPENERKFSFTALNTIFRARIRPIFEDVTFHVSPSVQPSFDTIQRLVHSAGGSVERSKPTLVQIANCIRYDRTFIVVLNENDVSEYEYLWEKNIPLFNEEFVLMSIIRHEFDTSVAYRHNPPDSNGFQLPAVAAVEQAKVKVA